LGSARAASPESGLSGWNLSRAARARKCRIDQYGAIAAAFAELEIIHVQYRHRAARPGDSRFRSFKLDIMRIQAGQIAAIAFSADLFRAFGLPPVR
jgi:hypothetical protein